MLTQSASQVRKREISMREIERVFRNRIISRDLWPAHFPDITRCDFCLWGRLKNAVSKTNPRILEELKCNIRDEINNINRGELQRVMRTFYKEVPKMYGLRRWKFHHLRQ